MHATLDPALRRLLSVILLVGATAAAACRDSEPPPTEMSAVRFLVWPQFFVGVRVHFVATATNTSDRPVELQDIRYRMTNADGAVVETGSVPQSYPKRIAPGAMAVIGRTVTADSARATEDVAAVEISYEAKRVDRADNLLEAVEPPVIGRDQFFQVEISGPIRSPGEHRYDNIKVAVLMRDASGEPLGFATANLPVDALEPGESAVFVTNADLPSAQVQDRIASVEVFASDQ